MSNQIQKVEVDQSWKEKCCDNVAHDHLAKIKAMLAGGWVHETFNEISRRQVEISALDY